MMKSRRRSQRSAVPAQLAHQVRAWRLRRGLTQEQLAKKLGITQPVISRLESRKESNMTVDTLIAIAYALDVSLAISFYSRGEFYRKGAKMEMPK